MRTPTLLLLLLLLRADPASGQETALHPEPILWHPLQLGVPDGRTVSADTAWIEVLARHSQPGGSRIRLPLLRLRTTAAQPGVPILYLAGGPGVAGLPTINRELAPHLLALRAHGDVILFDQRGTGRAQPNMDPSLRFELPPGASIASASARERLLERARESASILRARGVELSAYNTAESADDVEDIRAGLGVPKLVLWGHSYGSHLALAVLKRHPTSVERMILGGVNGLSQRWRPPADGDALLARIDSAIKADPKFRAAMPDFLGTVRRALERLDREPATVRLDGVTHVITRREVALVVALQSGDLEFVRRLPTLFAELDAGRALPFAIAARDVIRQRPVGTAMSYAMRAASGVSAERLARIERESATALLGNAINFPWDVEGFAAAWGVADLGEYFRAPVASDVPVLMFSGTFDGRTSVDDAREVKRTLSNSAHIIIDGASHNPYTAHPRVLELILEFSAGRPVRDEHIAATLGLRSPDEPAQVNELRRLALDAGIEEAIRRMRAIAQSPDRVMTSYVPGTVAIGLARDDRRPRDAIALLEAASALFPQATFLTDRLGDLYAGIGDQERSRAAWARSAAADPFNLAAIARSRAP